MQKNTAQTLIKLNKKALKTQQSVASEVWLTFTDGHRGIFQTTHTAIIDDAGAIKGVFAIGA